MIIAVDFWQVLLIGLVVVAIAVLVSSGSNRKSGDTGDEYKGAYRRAWILTRHEKDAFAKLRPMATELGYMVFAKVRLLDLVEPVKGTDNYQMYFNKVCSKHVDFVLVDQTLVARLVIELDDSSHDREDRRERDCFVDTVLTNVGYSVLHTRVLDDSVRKWIAEHTHRRNW